MRRTLFAFILAPLLCFAAGHMQRFEKFDSFFDDSELFYYATVQTSFGRGVGGIGSRYKNDEIGFDASITLSPPKKSSTQLLDIGATVLFFPYTEYLYAGFGAGVLFAAEEKLKSNAYLKGNLGLEKRFERAGNYFAEGTLQAPLNFDPKKPAIYPGFRIGVGY